MTHLKLQKLQKGDYPRAHRLNVNVLLSNVTLVQTVMYYANSENFCQNIVLCGQCLRIFFGIKQFFFSNSSLGSEKLMQNRHSLIKSRLTDLNNSSESE